MVSDISHSYPLRGAKVAKQPILRQYLNRQYLQYL